MDPSIRTGKLENGLTYYIKENQKPENRMALKLVVNAGSILEEEDQQGLAHFLEHMAFNGTEHFEKQELVDFLEGIGMRFGPELNAYTSFDETVYDLELPTDDEEIMEKAFLVLQDWAVGIRFDQEEIDKERGVVIEEWRLRQGAQQRIQEKQFPALLHQSRYAERLPIGKIKVIETAPRETFLRFYRKWYRPDLMALIAVGDFETDQIESMIRKYFDPLESENRTIGRPEFEVPEHQETLFSIATDPELQFSSIQIAYKQPHTEAETVEDYRQQLVESLYTSMLNTRLMEKTQQADPPYLQAFIGKSSFVRPTDCFLQAAAVRENAYEKGLRALLQEELRVKRDGFLQSELDRAKAVLLRGYEQAYLERDKRQSRSHANEIQRHYLAGEPVPGIGRERDIANQSVPGITLEETVNAARQWMTSENRVILFSAPEKESIRVPTEAELLAIIQQVESEELEAYDDGVSEAPLMENLPEPASILSEQIHAATEVTTLRLSNGIRVLVKSTDFQNDQILFQAFSPGGHSLVADDLFVPAATASTVVAQGGIGEFSAVALQKKLSGKVAYAQSFISSQSEGLSGSCSTKDLETLMQLIHLRFTSPRMDPETYQSLLVNVRENIRNRLNSPSAVFSDAVTSKLYGDHPRHQPATMEWLDKWDLETSHRIYRERFADANDFTFYFVGNIDLEILKPMLAQYIGTLPTLETEERGQFNGDVPAKGQLEVTVHKGLEPKASVSIQFYGEREWKDSYRYPLRSAVDALRIRLREELREDQGGVYGVNVSGGISRWPKATFSSGVSFGCDPENVDKLIQLALDIIEELKTEGPDEELLNKVSETHLRSYEKSIKENGFWLSNLLYRTRHDLPLEGILTFPTKPETLTANDIKQALVSYFDPSNRLIAKLLPEKKDSK